MKITPLGGAGSVTGSRFLVETQRHRILMECGLFQGLKSLRLKNWEPFPVPPASLDAVVLSHAHLDHTGYLPALVRAGYAGPVLVTPATADLLPVLLQDAAHLQEEDAAFANRKGFSRHARALPLFTRDDAKAACDLLESREWHSPFEVHDLQLQFFPAGHLLGAAMIRVEDEAGDSLLFSGDLGRSQDPLHPPPSPRPPSRRLLMEATYGNRSHAPEAPEEGLAAVVSRTLERGGVVLIPTFAVGRAQAILLLLHRLRKERRIPGVPVFLDSPMAIRASEVHLEHAGELRPEPGELTRALNAAEWVRTSEESKSLNRRRGPMVILAGSGMLTGGRILHHLQHYGGRHENLLILVGYQAEGTRGRELWRGERSLRMHGRWFDVRCQVESLELLSGHADREELVEWAASGTEPELGVGLVHGEPGPADHLRRRLMDRTGWRVEVAREGVPLFEGPGG